MTAPLVFLPGWCLGRNPLAATVDALWDRGVLGGRLPELAAEDWNAVLAYAARVASVTVSRPGADPPYRHEL